MTQWQPQYDPRQQRPSTPPPWQPGPQQPQYQPQAYYAPPPQQKPPRKSRKGLAFLGCGGLGALVILIAVTAAAGGSSSSSAPPAAQQPAAPAQPAAKAAAKASAAQTVTYVVTGSDADVTYGPAGTNLSGSVPMSVSKPLGTPVYYSIDAQLQGGGTVTCKIEVDGKAISTSTASGGYNIASCEISQDPFSGNWSDTNSG